MQRLQQSGLTDQLALTPGAAATIADLDGACLVNSAAMLIQQHWQEGGVLMVIGATGAVTRLIAPLGYELITARDGEDALNVVSDYGKEINLVLTDVIMPKMGGGDLVKALKTKYPHIKVIFMSGYTDDAVDQAELSLPNTYFLQKPVTRQQLTEKIRLALDG